MRILLAVGPALWLRAITSGQTKAPEPTTTLSGFLVGSGVLRSGLLQYSGRTLPAKTKTPETVTPLLGIRYGLRRSTLWPLSICRTISVLQSRQKTGRQSAWVSGVIRSSRLFRRHTGQAIHPSFVTSVSHSGFICNLFSPPFPFCA